MLRSGFVVATLVAALACVELKPPTAWSEGQGDDATASTDEQPRSVETVDADRFGVGWLERDGVVSSYLERVRFAVPSGWGVLRDDMVAIGIPTATIGMYHFEDDVAIFFLLERNIEYDTPEFRSDRRGRALSRFEATRPEPSMEASFAGATIELECVSGGPLDNDYLYALHMDGDDALQIVAYYPRKGNREHLRERVRAALATVELMREAEVEAVRAELARGPDVQNYVGPTWSLRRGVYRDFDRDFTWTSPSRDWVVHAGKRFEIQNLNGEWGATNKLANVSALLQVEEGPAAMAADAEAFHRANVARAVDVGFHQVGVPRSLTVGPATAMIQEFEFGAGLPGLDNRFVLATIKHETLALLWMIGGSPDQLAADPTLVDEVILNTRVGAGLHQIRQVGARYSDLRLGYSVEIPDGYAGLPVSELDEGVEVKGWVSDDGGSTLSVLTSPFAYSGRVAEGNVAWMEKSFAEPLGLEPIAVELEQATLGGLVGRRLEATRPGGVRRMLIVTRDFTTYALLFDGVDPAVFEAARERFDFI